MARFLTTAWVDDLDRAAATLTCAAGTEVCIEHDFGGFTYHVVLADERVRFHAGPAPTATARLAADADTAGAIARGELSAQRAFMNGLLRVGGDALALERALPAMRALGDAFAGVREQTEW